MDLVELIVQRETMLYALAAFFALIIAYIVHELRLRAQNSSRVELKKLQLVEAEQRVDTVKSLINLVPSENRSRELDEIRKSIASMSQDLAATTLEGELRTEKIEVETTLRQARKLLEELKSKERTIKG